MSSYCSRVDAKGLKPLPLGQREASRELTVTQSKYLDRHHSLVLTWRRVWQDGRAANDGQVMLKRLF